MEIAVATWSCFRELEPGVKWILSDLLDIAAERGNCKESPEGERYLDGIPMEELCHTMIAALNVTKMKHYAAQVQTLTACSRTAAEIVKMEFGLCCLCIWNHMKQNRGKRKDV